MIKICIRTTQPSGPQRLCLWKSLLCGKCTAVDFIFRNTVLYCTYIFYTHLITFSNDFHVACHRVSLDDCKKISLLLLLLLLLVVVALLKSASVVHWSRQSSIVARPLHLRDKCIKQTPPCGCGFGDHSHVYTWWINIKTNSILWMQFW